MIPASVTFLDGAIGDGSCPYCVARACHGPGGERVENFEPDP